MGIKLITWNVQWCCGLDGRVDPQRIVAAAQALSDFDVLCLQEVADNYPALRGNAGADQSQQLAAALPGFSAWFGPSVDEVREPGGRSRFGNLILSRLPVYEFRIERLPWPVDPGVATMPRTCTVITVAAAALGPVRVMTTHLEYGSDRQRLAQAHALRALHQEACAQARSPPPATEDGSPFRARRHSASAILCGDFNAAPDSAEHAAITAVMPGDAQTSRLIDAWGIAGGGRPQDPTFKVFDKTYGPDPIACDFIFVSAHLAPAVRRMTVDGHTRASDHQPVMIELAG